MINTERLIETFVRYTACDSESGRERVFCEMMEGELTALGMTIRRDDVGTQCDSDGWNIHGYLPGEGEPILFSAHMDTVPPGEGVRAVVEDGVIRSAGDTVLGADDKAGLAAIMEAVRAAREQGVVHRPVEVLFTICEERGLLGSRYADYSQIRSKEAVVLDSNTPGELINQGPAKLVLHVEITGKSAHGALAPERGVNAVKAAAAAIAAIPTGYVDDCTVINVANFMAPGKSNVVPEKAGFDMDIRALDKAVLLEHQRQIEATIEAACAEIGATWKTQEDWQTDVLFVPPSSPVLAKLKQVYDDLGVAWKVDKTFGGSDATWLFERGGMDVINIGTGMTDVHSTQEHIAVADLEITARAVLGMMMI
ncbi:MAG: M20/M25/M40 family metallo-hydrolase [Oscillospiraceae bacterium]|nr:M20/M25/M40 family metallo-hydrolase [Oscillospiraceae bacterium]